MTVSHRPRYQVFISSTYEDLRNEREAATWAVMKCGHIATGMETFPAKNDRGWETITDTIDNSDYYLLIMAGRYGEIDHNESNSWTELEYKYAHSKGVPILAFIRNNTSITSDKIEKNKTSSEKLKRFITDIKKKHHYRNWSTKDDLANELTAALTSHIADDIAKNRARPGWFRGPITKDAKGVFRGLSEFRSTFHGYSYEAIVKNSEKLIIIMNDGRSWIDSHRELLEYRAKIKKQKTTCVFIHPQSNFLKTLVNKNGKGLRNQLGELRRSISILEKIEQEHGLIEIKAHHFFNPYSLVLSDQLAVVTPYHYMESGSLPMLIFDADHENSLYSKYEDDAKKLIETSERISSLDIDKALSLHIP